MPVVMPHGEDIVLPPQRERERDRCKNKALRERGVEAKWKPDLAGRLRPRDGEERQ
jgi:hypothetical protein